MKFCAEGAEFLRKVSPLLESHWWMEALKVVPGGQAAQLARARSKS